MGEELSEFERVNCLQVDSRSPQAEALRFVSVFSWNWNNLIEAVLKSYYVVGLLTGCVIIRIVKIFKRLVHKFNQFVLLDVRNTLHYYF